MCDVTCKFKDKCTSYPNNCYSCVNNEGKRNYYYPAPYPYYPYYPIITWHVTNAPIGTTGEYYNSP